MILKKFNVLAFTMLLIFTTTAFSDETKQYDTTAKTTYSKNDVKSFVYKWFAMFDHQEEIINFKKHLPKENVVMNFPDFPIRTLADFEKWYQGVIDNIQFNSHDIRGLKVSGNEKDGFKVSFIVNWKANTYDKKSYNVDVAQAWEIKVDKNRTFVITNHKAWVI